VTRDGGIEKLLDEIRRYLEAVDVFRAEGCEPTWRPVRERSGPRLRRGARVRT
jgi:hypothetical protein